MLSQDFLYQLKAANPIEQVMSGYVNLIKTGGRYKCLCPFHSERTPSCVVYANTQDPGFYCFGCHAGGDVITFLMRIENLTYMDAVRMLAERAGMTIPAENRAAQQEVSQRMRMLELNRAAARFYFQQLTGADKRGISYLINRGLSPETVRKFGLGYAGDDWEGLTRAMRAQGFSEEELVAANLAVRSERGGRLRDRFRSRVMFPIFDMRGSVIAFGGRILDPDGKPKYLNSADTLVYNKRRNLFALHLAAKSQSKRIILAEGYMDVISIYQAGFHNVTASLGTALTPEQCRLLQQHKFEEVVIAYDSDFAGQNAAVRALNPMREIGLRAYRLQLHDAKDPDEYIKKFGDVYFRKLLEEAPGAIEFELARSKAEAKDPGTESGTVDALHRAVNVLVQIDNDMDREIYLTKTAADYGISPDILRAQVKQALEKRRRAEKKQSWTALTTAGMMPDPVVPDAQGKKRAVVAEERILCYLFRFPSELERVMQLIPPEEFVTDLHRRIYQHLAQKLKQGYAFSLSLFSEDFSPQEMGRITGISAEFEGQEISEASIARDAARIREKKPTAEELQGMDDAAFSQTMANLRSRKTGAAPQTDAY